MIERRGRPHAVIMSALDFKIVERIIAHQSADTATTLLAGAVEKIASGQLGKAVRLRHASHLLAQLVK